MLQCDTSLRDAFTILADPLQAFRNPLTSRIGSLQSNGWSLKERLISEIMSPGPKPSGVTQSEWDARLAAMADLHTLFVDVFASPSGFANSKVGQLKSYTDFMSGQHGFASPFPSNVLSGVGANVAGGALLATATFGTVISVAGGAKPMAQNLCRVSSLPNVPLPEACAGSNNIFAMILGAYNAVLDTVNTLLSTIAGFITQTAANLLALQQQINQFVDSLVAAIARELGNLVAALLEQLRYALALLMKGMATDPCTAAILQTICQPAMAAALQVNILPNFGSQMQIPNYL